MANRFIVLFLFVLYLKRRREEERHTYRGFFGKLEEKRPLEKSRHRCDKNIVTDIK